MVANDVPGLATLSRTFGLTVKDNSTQNAVVNGDTATSEALDNRVVEVLDDDSKEKGAVSSVKNIYQSSKDSHGHWTWVDKYPEDVAEAAENNETEKFAIVIRNKKSEDSRKKLEADSIIVQSPWLKKALGQILEDYPGVTCELQRLIFEAPFAPFVHRWSAFLKFMKRNDIDKTTKEHLSLLHDILKYEIGDAIKEFEDYVLNGVITYDSLWMIFQPGGVVISEHRGPLSAFELNYSEYQDDRCGKYLQLKCDCVDWDGKHFGRYTESIRIFKFSGTRKITSLNAFPLSFSETKEETRLQLIERGERFEALVGYQYKAYSGTAITWDREGNEQNIHVSGRIVIDVDSFNRFAPYQRRYLSNLTEKDVEMLYRHNEKYDSKDEKSGYGQTSALIKPSESRRIKLTPYHLMLCRSRTRGYSIKLKMWLDFFVELVTEIEWSKKAFESLVLPEDQKEMILSFTESQVQNHDAFDDVISGKGRGIIMLLSGPPGVGKTLTAEAVAEHMHCPLHSITSGDLGSEAYQVEAGLSKTLELVARWKAILLIDECDVFLEARSAHDLKRNRVVSIFLRTLEYYEGIMFMTTNRVDNMDAAFQSRIHVSLEYPDLTTDSRRQVWQSFLKASPERYNLSDKDLDELSLIQLNGRQIKNLLKAANLLALRKKQPLNMAILGTVLATEKRRPEMHALNA